MNLKYAVILRRYAPAVKHYLLALCFVPTSLRRFAGRGAALFRGLHGGAGRAAFLAAQAPKGDGMAIFGALSWGRRRRFHHDIGYVFPGRGNGVNDPLSALIVVARGFAFHPRTVGYFAGAVKHGLLNCVTTLVRIAAGLKGDCERAFSIAAPGVVPVDRGCVYPGVCRGVEEGLKQPRASFYLPGYNSLDGFLFSRWDRVLTGKPTGEGMVLDTQVSCVFGKTRFRPKG